MFHFDHDNHYSIHVYFGYYAVIANSEPPISAESFALEWFRECPRIIMLRDSFFQKPQNPFARRRVE
jgi:hypothetical protein